MPKILLNATLFAILSCVVLPFLNPASAQESNVTKDSQNINLDFMDAGEVPTLEEMRAMEEHVRQVSDRVKEATVNIQVGGAQGTGIIISRDGYVLTAAHVIGRPNVNANIVLPDGTRMRCKTLGLNRGLDSGMLKIDGDGPFPYLDLGESESLKKGQWIMAVGHPGGWNEKRGMVVRVGRILSATSRVIRTDCVLVGGDSGGPLVNMDGEVIGIHSRISRQVWENLHVPVDGFSDEWDELAAGKIVGGSTGPYVGLSFKNNTNEISEAPADGPAADAGIQVGDLIIKVNNTEIKSKLDFQRIARRLKPEQELDIVVKRGDDEKEITLTVGQR